MTPPTFRVGNGFDVHRLVADRDLWICGVKIPHTLGLLGHSDADVALHALSDALLGAASLRDIGSHFPDTDPADKGYAVGNVDLTIMAQAPKMLPHFPVMISNIADDLGIDPDCVSVKATTTERLGFTGREEGIAAMATALIYKM